LEEKAHWKKFNNVNNNVLILDNLKVDVRHGGTDPLFCN
jgi:arginine/lysine/ornithine decarboxylase